MSAETDGEIVQKSIERSTKRKKPELIPQVAAGENATPPQMKKMKVIVPVGAEPNLPESLTKMIKVFNPRVRSNKLMPKPNIPSTHVVYIGEEKQKRDSALSVFNAMKSQAPITSKQPLCFRSNTIPRAALHVLPTKIPPSPTSRPVADVGNGLVNGGAASPSSNNYLKFVPSQKPETPTSSSVNITESAVGEDGIPSSEFMEPLMSSPPPSSRTRRFETTQPAASTAIARSRRPKKPASTSTASSSFPNLTPIISQPSIQIIATPSNGETEVTMSTTVTAPMLSDPVQRTRIQTLTIPSSMFPPPGNSLQIVFTLLEMTGPAAIQQPQTVIAQQPQHVRPPASPSSSANSNVPAPSTSSKEMAAAVQVVKQEIHDS